jgi:hypothetical protein
MQQYVIREIIYSTSLLARTGSAGQGRRDWPIWPRPEDQDPGQWSAGHAVHGENLAHISCKQAPNLSAAGLLSFCTSLFGTLEVVSICTSCARPHSAGAMAAGPGCVEQAGGSKLRTWACLVFRAFQSLCGAATAGSTVLSHSRCSACWQWSCHGGHAVVQAAHSNFSCLGLDWHTAFEPAIKIRRCCGYQLEHAYHIVGCNWLTCSHKVFEVKHCQQHCDVNTCAAIFLRTEVQGTHFGVSGPGGFAMRFFEEQHPSLPSVSGSACDSGTRGTFHLLQKQNEHH